jgi:hypothetical protein
MKYKIRRISTFSVARFGCLLGWIITVLPSLACGLLGLQVAAAVLDWLQSWEQFSIKALGFQYTLDLIELLKLQDVVAALQTARDLATPALISLLIVVAVGGGLVIAFFLILLGWGYNLLARLTGGIEVELAEVPDPPVERQPATHTQHGVRKL